MGNCSVNLDNEGASCADAEPILLKNDGLPSVSMLALAIVRNSRLPKSPDRMCLLFFMTDPPRHFLETRACMLADPDSQTF